MYSRVVKKNPLYRIPVMRKIKHVLMAHALPECLEKIVNTPIFKKLMGAEAIRKMRDDQVLQTMIEKKTVGFFIEKSKNVRFYEKQGSLFHFDQC